MYVPFAHFNDCPIFPSRLDGSVGHIVDVRDFPSRYLRHDPTPSYHLDGSIRVANCGAPWELTVTSIEWYIMAVERCSGC